MREEQFIWHVVVPILVCLIGAVVVNSLGFSILAMFISHGGTGIVLGANLFLTVWKRSRQR